MKKGRRARPHPEGWGLPAPPLQPRELKDEDLLFICKPHPHDEGAFQTYDGEHIHILLNDDLRETDTTVYDFLSAVDVLITDYSSIYFDYLHLNLPIVFHVPDIEEYRMQRGFILEPFRDWAPGDISTTIDELIASLTNALADPGRWEPERTRLQKLVFRYADGLACERVCRLIEQRQSGRAEGIPGPLKRGGR